MPDPVRAGPDQVRVEATLEQTPHVPLEAAARAAAEPAHVRRRSIPKKGPDAEAILDFLPGTACAGPAGPLSYGQGAGFWAARGLAQAGVMLEYDTFYRPKYGPEKNCGP